MHSNNNSEKKDVEGKELLSDERNVRPDPFPFPLSSSSSTYSLISPISNEQTHQPPTIRTISFSTNDNNKLERPLFSPSTYSYTINENEEKEYLDNKLENGLQSQSKDNNHQSSDTNLPPSSVKPSDHSLIIPNVPSLSSISPPLPCPQEDCLHTWYRLPSLLYFGWFSPMVALGAKRPLQQSDLWDTFVTERCENCWESFVPAWEETKEKAKKKGKEPKLLNAFTRMMGVTFLISCLGYGWSVADTLLGPQFLNELVNYQVKSMYESVPVWEGYKWVVMMFCSACGAAISRSFGMHLALRLFLRVRNVLIVAIYRKSLRVSGKYRRDGAANSLMASDTQKISDFAQQVHNLWSAPIILGVGIYELYVQVQWSAIVGLGVMVVLLPIVAIVTKKQMGYQKKAAIETDKRVTLINEFILGIRVVKYYAWEKPFLKRLDDQREEELNYFRKYVYAKSFTFGVLLLVPLIVSVAIFGIYVATGGVMSPSVVFTTVSLINVIRMPFTFIPIAIAQLTQVLISFGRIEKFLALPEVDANARLSLNKVGVQMKEAQFTWPPSEEDKGKKGKAKITEEGKGKEKGKEKEKGGEGKKESKNKKGKELKPNPTHPTPVSNINRDRAVAESTLAGTSTASSAGLSSGGGFAPTDTNATMEAASDLILDEIPTTKGNSTQNTNLLNLSATTSSTLTLTSPKAAPPAYTANDSDARLLPDSATTSTISSPTPLPELIPRLTNVNIFLSAGELTLVLGPVGSGKSTLLYGILGEVDQTGGNTAIGGRIAYVPQTPFIINASVRENIIFGNKFNKERYDAVIYASALLSDLAILPNGDLTEIGERGINLSGGQKQRLQIARAAYQDSDIVLMDDPLSAVDMHVSRHIFTHCIQGIMKNRLRILSTHSMAYVDEVDKILMVKETNTKDCYTIKEGTAEELRKNDAEFRSLLNTYHRGEDSITQKKTKPETEEGVSTQSNKSDVVTDGKKSATALLAEADEKNKRGKLMEMEEREQGEVNWSVYLGYLTAGGSLFFYTVLPIVFLGTQACQTAGDFWLARWSNNLVNSEYSQGFWLGIYGLFVFSTLVATIGRTTSFGIFGLASSKTLHHNLSQSILSKSISWFDRTPGGRIINRFTKDMYSVDIMLSLMGEFSIALTLQVIGILVVISIIVPVMLAVFLPLAVLYFYISIYYRKTNTELQRLESISRTPIYSHFAETLAGTITIRALKVQSLYIEENVRRANANSRALYFSRTANFWLTVRLYLIGALILGTCGALAVGGVGGTISAGNFGLLITYALSVTTALNIAVILSANVETLMNSVERILFYSVPRDHENWVPRNKELSASIQSGIWPSKGKIVIEKLQLRYRADLDLVLKGISVTIQPGQKIGIVGRTGSGKSSILVALFRMVEPCAGSIIVDGVNIQDVSVTDVRTNISIIPQDAVLFYGSLRYNLDPFDNYTEAEIRQALKYVQLDDVIDRMPNKLSTLVSEAGSNLSGGQRQLMCLARALLRKPKIVCLDEATANVDIETDDIIQRIIRQEFDNSTILTIAHRLNTVLDYDRIIVMDAGHIAEFGTPNELRSKEGGIFASMLRQATEAADAAGAGSGAANEN